MNGCACVKVARQAPEFVEDRSKEGTVTRWERLSVESRDKVDL
jgi:hypothetical protein